MRRINQSNLEAVVTRINQLTNSPLVPWSKDKQGKFKANIGNYHIDSAYGGHRLVRHINEGGGITVIIDGFSPKRELYEKMHAFIMGMDAKS